MYKFLNDDDCEKIIKMFNEGVNKNLLSKEFGVSHPTISNIIKRNLKPRERGNKKYIVDEEYFSTIDTEDKAYWLGFLYADGYVLEKNKTLIAGITLKDLDHIEKFKSDIKSTHLIKNAKTKNNYSFNIYNTNFSRHLVNQGCIPRKSFKIEFPKLKDTLENHFIRGYFDGDGSVSATDKTLQLTICCASEKFLFDLVEKMKINANLKRYKIYKRKDGLLIYVNSSGEDILNIRKYLYKNSTTFLGRKKEVFDYIDSNILEIKKRIGKYSWQRKKKRDLSKV
jgi:hypothetical protein